VQITRDQKMTLYAYTDETEFKKSDTELFSVVGTGLFITDSEIDSSVVTEAMDELRKNEQKNRSDILTLERGFFHASKDSNNARLCICRSISKNISGHFRYSFYERNKQKPWESVKSTESLNRLTLETTSLEFFDNKIDKIVLTIEERKGFKENAVLNWIQNFYKQLDIMAYRLPSLHTYYPDFDIIVAKKSNSGLQVTDFILWTLNRANKIIPDKIWVENLNFTLYSDFHEQNGPQSGGDYCLNNYSLNFENIGYPFSTKKVLTDEEFYQAYLTIEHIVRHICKKDLPEHILHLKPLLKGLMYLFDKDKTLTKEKLRQMALVYIRFFDTLPVYKDIENTDETSWTLCLNAKKLSGLLLRNNLIHSGRSSIAILKWREEIMRNNKKLLICT